MPFCRECAAEVTAAMKFCPECAAPQQDSSPPKVNMNSLRDNRKANLQKWKDRKEALQVKRNLHFYRAFYGVLFTLFILGWSTMGNPDLSTPPESETVSMTEVMELIRLLALMFCVPLIIYNLVAGVYLLVMDYIVESSP